MKQTLRHAWDRLLAVRLQRYAPAQVRWPLVRRLVFVCQGNVCRSPFAEHWCRREGIVTASFGLGGIKDKAADPAATRNAEAFAVDLRGHRGARLADFVFADGDLVIGFEARHVDDCMALRPAAQADRQVQYVLLGMAARPPLGQLRDPYGLGDPVFADVFGRIERCLANLRDEARAAGAQFVRE